MFACFGGRRLTASEQYAAACRPRAGARRSRAHSRVRAGRRGVRCGVGAAQNAVSLDPTFAAVHAARGNLLLRRGKTDAAQRSYALAARFDPYDAPSRIALGRAGVHGGRRAAPPRRGSTRRSRSRTTTRRRRAPARARRSCCASSGPWHRNIPLDFVVDPERWTLHRWYLPDAAPPTCRLRAAGVRRRDRRDRRERDARPAGVGGAALHRGADQTGDQRSAARRARRRGDALAATLRGIAGCACRRRAARAPRRARCAIAERLSAARAAGRRARRPRTRARRRRRGAAQRTPRAPRREAYDVGAFVDYRGADGFYRKYRVMFVDGEPFPYHLAARRDVDDPLPPRADGRARLDARRGTAFSRDPGGSACRAGTTTLRGDRRRRRARLRRHRLHACSPTGRSSSSRPTRRCSSTGSTRHPRNARPTNASAPRSPPCSKRARAGATFRARERSERSDGTQNRNRALPGGVVLVLRARAQEADRPAARLHGSSTNRTRTPSATKRRPPRGRPASRSWSTATSSSTTTTTSFRISKRSTAPAFRSKRPGASSFTPSKRGPAPRSCGASAARIPAAAVRSPARRARTDSRRTTSCSPRAARRRRVGRANRVRRGSARPARRRAG